MEYNRKSDLVVEGTLTALNVVLLGLALQPVVEPIRNELLGITGFLSTVTIATILEFARQEKAKLSSD